MENSIIPSATQIRNDYMNGIELQKNIAKAIRNAANGGRTSISIQVTEQQGVYLVSILKDLDYFTILYPVRSHDDDSIVYFILEISW